ncbi:MAG: hypothetical protein C4527_29435 [Candidatus Omnitrophota bacterium]|jgi:hypothetical protein|nr:MAG: hypothetical protein C4527_29435 [Candidatus Omnitrophota bacterium]
MPQITIDLNSETAQRIKQLADSHGVPIDEEVRNILSQVIIHKGHIAQFETDKPDARERFERHFGAMDIEYAAGADNEQIDAELMTEYSAAQKEN